MTAPFPRGGGPPLGLLIVMAAALAIQARLPAPPRSTGIVDRSLPLPGMAVEGDRVLLGTSGRGEVRYTLDGSTPGPRSPIAHRAILPQPDHAAAERRMRIPTSIQWRPPVYGTAAASVLRARTCLDGRCGPETITTRPTVDHHLPVIALTADDRDLFDTRTGIYVVGHAGLMDADATAAYERDRRWWKYPGNYQLRGPDHERTVHLEWIDRGGERFASDGRVRIHGNNTRGFAQHALRVVLSGPAPMDIVGGAAHGKGPREFVLRAGGNDQSRAFMRDLVQHRACASLPFATGQGRTHVVYINGAYWGLHHVRERVDDDELARRHGGSAKRYAILEDRLIPYRAEQRDVADLTRLITMAGRWDATAPWYVDSVARRMDIDDFLAYMAAQLILANSDWPDQNVRYWRWNGKRTEGGAHDGRWRYIMGDSDLGMGYATGVGVDMFAHVARHQGPVARLFNSLMRSPTLRQRLATHVRTMLDGPLSAGALTAVIDACANELEPEMPRHIARWRMPTSMDRWRHHVEDLRAFARGREAVVRQQVERWIPAKP